MKPGRSSFPWGLLSCGVVLTCLSACGGGDDADNDSASTQTSSTSVVHFGVSDGDSANSPSAAPASASATPAATTEPDASQMKALSDFQAQVLQRVNDVRASGTTCGGVNAPAVPALRWNAALEKAAKKHSQDMATNNYFSHTSKDGRTFAQRITAAGYSYRLAAENIAAGQQSVDSVMKGWLASAGHCRNIMLAGAKDIGVAVVRTTHADFPTYWTMDLASPR